MKALKFFTLLNFIALQFALGLTLPALANPQDFQGVKKAPPETEQLPLSMLPDFVQALQVPLIFSESRFGSGGLVDQFPLVIWINKASSGPTAQRIRIYINGVKEYEDRISTGREKWEKTPSGRTYFSRTPTGYYVPYWIDKDHVSSLWKTAMPWAVFFNGGIAIHQVPNGAEGKLGTRASGGCVRARPSVAKYVYQLIEHYGKGKVPRFNVNGYFVRSATGEILTQEAYRTLIIVEDRSTAVADANLEPTE